MNEEPMPSTNHQPTSNWGRWGAADEIGALNLITPERTRAAAHGVREGRVLSLGLPLRHDLPRVEDRPGPTHILTVDGGDYAAGARGAGGAFFADDFVSMPVGTGTHIDALAHAWSADGLYNGHDPNTVRSRGARYCGIDKIPGIVTGGVLADVCALHGVPALAPSHLITAAELEAATDGAGAPVGAGDALLIRTGWLTPANLEGRDRRRLEREEPGIGTEAAAWIAERDIALVGADTLGVEVFPEEDPNARAPIHVQLISRLGVHLVEMRDLEQLAALRPGRFLFVLAPLRIHGGVNSPVNPLAIL
jgi:kynurenine formamidase